MKSSTNNNADGRCIKCAMTILFYHVNPFAFPCELAAEHADLMQEKTLAFVILHGFTGIAFTSAAPMASMSASAVLVAPLNESMLTAFVRIASANT